MKSNKRKTRTNSLLKRIKAALRKERGKAPGKATGYYPRHLARSIAKANMKRAGIQHINRNFALNWKNWVGGR